MKKIELKLYRHKYFKYVYLARNYGYCGGNKDTPFYYGTKELCLPVSEFEVVILEENDRK